MALSLLLAAGNPMPALARAAEPAGPGEGRGARRTAPAALGSACAPWSSWGLFKRRFLLPEGRVVDPSTERLHTVSEGQAYAMFFALVDNDRATFERLLRWTAAELSQGDLAARLPAWQWGRRDDGRWGVIDTNAASDADLWIAYALLEAGRLWRERRYRVMGTALAARILADETAELPGLGRALLPGPVGFTPGEGRWRLNPSYVPLQVLRRLAGALPHEPRWGELVGTAERLVIETAPRGFSPDWVEYRADGGFVPDADSDATGSYDAIRVYLWAGMLDAADPARARVLGVFAPLARHVAAPAGPPERVAPRSGKVGPASGPPGFSAAVAPLLLAAGDRPGAAVQAGRAAQAVERGQLGYYDHALALFGLGFLAGRWRFAADGSLVVPWRSSCSAARPVRA